MLSGEVSVLRVTHSARVDPESDADSARNVVEAAARHSAAPIEHRSMDVTETGGIRSTSI
jgi:hypothetical protein